MNWLQSIIELFTRLSVTTIAAWVALVQVVREAIPLVKTTLDTMALPPAASMTSLGVWTAVLAALLLWVWLSGDARLKLTATLYGRWRQAAGASMINLNQTDPVAFYSSLKNVVSVRWSGWAKPVSVRVRGTAGIVTVGLQIQFLRDLQSLTGGKEKYVCSFKNLGRGWLEAKAVGRLTSKIEASMLKTLEELELIAVVRPSVFDESTVINVSEESTPVESITWAVNDGGMLRPDEKQALASSLAEARGGDWLVSSTPDGMVKASRVQADGPVIMEEDGNGGYKASEATPDWMREQQARMSGQAGGQPYGGAARNAGYFGYGYGQTQPGTQWAGHGQGNSQYNQPNGDKFRGGKPANVNYVNLDN